MAMRLVPQQGQRLVTPLLQEAIQLLQLFPLELGIHPSHQRRRRF